MGFFRKKFHYFSYYDFPRDVYGALSEPNEYIGLKDINKKEIFEGDFVNFVLPGKAHGPDTEVYSNEPVWYDEECAGFVFGRQYYDGWHGYHPYEIKEIEVVGNIFENAELL